MGICMCFQFDRKGNNDFFLFFFFWCGKSIRDSLILSSAGRKTVGFVHHFISPDIETSSPEEAAYFCALHFSFEALISNS